MRRTHQLHLMHCRGRGNTHDRVGSQDAELECECSRLHLQQPHLPGEMAHATPQPLTSRMSTCIPPATPASHAHHQPQPTGTTRNTNQLQSDETICPPHHRATLSQAVSRLALQAAPGGLAALAVAGADGGLGAGCSCPGDVGAAGAGVAGILLAQDAKRLLCKCWVGDSGALVLLVEQAKSRNCCLAMAPTLTVQQPLTAFPRRLRPLQAVQGSGRQARTLGMPPLRAMARRVSMMPLTSLSSTAMSAARLVAPSLIAAFTPVTTSGQRSWRQEEGAGQVAGCVRQVQKNSSRGASQALVHRAAVLPSGHVLSRCSTDRHGPAGRHMPTCMQR